MLTLLVVLTSASPVATDLEISSTGSLPPHERSHRNRSHALHRAQRRHPRHGFSCGPTFFQLRSPAAATPSFCSQRRPVRVVRRSPAFVRRGTELPEKKSALPKDLFHLNFHVSFCQ